MPVAEKRAPKARRVSRAKAETLQSVAREIYERMGSGKKAVRALVLAYEARPSLRQEILTATAEVELSMCVRAHRRGIRSDAANAAATEGDIEAMMRRHPASWPLANGKALRDATREEILVQISVHQDQAKGHMRNADFLAAVAKRLARPGVRCGDMLTDEQISEIYRESTEHGS